MNLYSLGFLFFTMLSNHLFCQEVVVSEKYGKTLNSGAGIGYYGYLGQIVPFATANFEFDVAKNFTLAPFIGIYAYQRSYYWGDNFNSNRYYTCKTIVLPVGVKGAYYFDQLLHLNSKWDIYVATSIGFAFRKSIWDNGYYGNRNIEKSESPIYLGIHTGVEYYLNNKTGLFLDLSTGVSTFGLAIHL